MESTKKLFVGQTVVVTKMDENSAEAFDAVVLDIAATGASALVARSTDCHQFVKEHGPSYLTALMQHDESCEEGKELAVRVKAGDINPFTKEASQLIAKFKGVAAERSKLTSDLAGIVKQIADLAPKPAPKAEKASEGDKKPAAPKKAAPAGAK